jgi:5-formyltetrahydrofolate cyclo-ligase
LAERKSNDAPDALGDLKLAINEFRRRLDSRRHAAVAQMADRLRTQIAAMEETLAAPLQRDLDLADRLAVALYVSFKSDGDVQALAEKINKALEGFEKRRSAGAAAMAKPA